MSSENELESQLVSDRPVKVVVAGAGVMGMAWLRAIEGHRDLRLVGVADKDERRAKGAAIRIRRADLPIAATIDALAATADVCVNVTPPDAHHAVVGAALRAGLSVLTEKPFARSMAEALELTELAAARGRLLMVAQTRRYEPGVAQLQVMASRLGRLNLVTTEFRRAYRQAGFRLSMPHPLLLDMAVHSFDTARLLTGERPQAVYAVEFNPAHSWFSESAAAIVNVEFTNNINYCYTGSWCADGAETSWSGRWRIDGELGACDWSGDTTPTCSVGEPFNDDPPVSVADDPVSQVAGSLQDFVSALRTGATPWGEASSNLLSFAIAQAAILSARRRERVLIDELLRTLSSA